MGGRAPKKMEERYVAVFDEVIGPDQFYKIVAQVFAQALNGCVGSQNLLFKYVMPNAEKARDGIESQDEATCRIAGSANREAFKKEMIGRALMLAQELLKNGKPKKAKKKKPNDADGSVG